MTTHNKRDPIGIEYATVTQAVTSTTTWQTPTGGTVEVWPFSTMRFDGTSTDHDVDIRIQGSIDDGTTYADTITSYTQKTTSAAASKTSTTKYSFIRIQCKRSTSSTASGTATVKYMCHT
jgi:hypothetical protein